MASSDTVLIGWNFNSSTGTDPDYVIKDTKDFTFLLGDCELDTFRDLQCLEIMKMF